MVFLKKVEIRKSESQYGQNQSGVYALEPILKDEIIFSCECGKNDLLFNRRQLLEIIEKFPNLDYFIRSYSYQIADDHYFLPKTYMEQRNNDECALFNHSCKIIFISK
jgi:hypothetical protein